MKSSPGLVPSLTALATAKAASFWFWRGFKRGDWLWLWLAVVIASTSVTLVEQLAQTVHNSMLTRAAESLSADLVLRSSRPIDAAIKKQALERGLEVSENLSFTTMAMVDEQFQMVMLKGIDAHYPLRGTLATEYKTQPQTLSNTEVLADPQLQGLTDLKLNGELVLGRTTFKVKDWLSNQDVFQSTFSQFAPQVIMPLEQVESLGLIGPGSRINYELSFAGKDTTLVDWQALLDQQQQAHWQIISARAPTPDLEKSLETAWLFLDLSALATVLIAGLAILIASRFYLERWTASMALMRATGASNRQLSSLFALQLSYLALFGSVLGVLIGLLLFNLAKPWLADYFVPLVVPGYGSAIWLGLVSGTLALWTFAWPAFRQATQVSPLRVLRQGNASTNTLALVGVSIVLLIGLIWLLLDNQLIIWAVPAILISAGVLYVLAQALLFLLHKLQPLSRGWLRLALAALARSPGLVTMQLIALGLVMFILILMSFVRQDLMTNWQASLPQNTPNTFVMSIQPDQAQTIQQIFESYQLHAELVPMVRGRLVARNGETLRAENFTQTRAQRLLEREANIAVLSEVPQHNVITQQLRAAQFNDLPKVSLETDIAELFGLKLGDILTFDLVGQRFDYQVSALRQVEWQSFKLNFFFIIEPDLERPLSFTYITNFRSDLSAAETSQVRREVNQQLDGVLWLDAREMIEQVQRIMQQASVAVSVLYVFTLISSFIVIFTATRASQLGRLRSWLLLRTIGARQADIIKIGLTEFMLIGLLAGVFAASLAQIASMLIGHFWLDLSPSINPWLWLISIASSVLVLLIIGWLTQRDALTRTPKQLLQKLQADS